jgi:hypothetical protein
MPKPNQYNNSVIISVRHMKQKLTKNQLILSVGALIIALGAAGMAWHPWHKPASTAIPAANTSQNSGSNGNSSNINYGPPSSSEQQAANDYKKTLSANQPPSSGGTKSISVQVLSATASKIRVNIIGVFEDGGTCTATLTKGAQTTTATGTGIAASNYTQCNINLGAGQVTGGGWSVVVSYSSADASGKSTSTPLTD